MGGRNAEEMAAFFCCCETVVCSNSFSGRDCEFYTGHGLYFFGERECESVRERKQEIKIWGEENWI